MTRVAVFCLSVLFSSLSLASDLGARYQNLWGGAKWEENKRCGQIKVDLLNQIIHQLAKRPIPIRVVETEFESDTDLKNECRVLRNGFLALANGDICRALIFSNQFMLLNEKEPQVYLRLDCIGTDKRAQFSETSIRLRN
jgi:hypothetical protein